MVSKIDLRTKRDLLNDISQVYYLLNGQTSNGQNATYGSLFKTTRYAIILLAAITLQNFKDQTVKIKETPFYNFYRLEKVADFLRLEYDRTKQAKKIYEDLEIKGEVEKEVTEDNKTYISLTEKGITNCLRKIDELHHLRDYFARLPPLEQHYIEEELAGKSVSALKSKSSVMIEHESNIEKLIRSISE
ncbi:MAG: hypothetical protein ACRD47_10865 [Nitrososphaeraceae archaeon]